MADLLPSSPDTSAAEDADPRVVGVDSDDADDLIAALSSATARELLDALHDEPANPAKLADAVDTTIQNAQYHLGKLEDAGLIEVVDTVYSEKGREMSVYAPSDRPLVVVAGGDAETDDVQAALSRLFGALAALAVGSAVVQQLLTGDLLPFGLGSGGDAGVEEGRDGAAAGGDDGDAGGGDGADGPTEEGDSTNLSAEDPGTETAADATGTPTPDDVGAADATGTPTPEPTGTPTEAPVATGTPTPTPESTPTEVATQAATEVTEFAAAASPEVAPGLLFFAGGAAVLGVGFAYRYLQLRG